VGWFSFALTSKHMMDTHMAQTHCGVCVERKTS